MASSSLGVLSCFSAMEDCHLPCFISPPLSFPGCCCSAAADDLKDPSLSLSVYVRMCLCLSLNNEQPEGRGRVREDNLYHTKR